MQARDALDFVDAAHAALDSRARSVSRLTTFDLISDAGCIQAGKACSAELRVRYEREWETGVAPFSIRKRGGTYGER